MKMFYNGKGFCPKNFCLKMSPSTTKMRRKKTGASACLKEIESLFIIDGEL